MPHHTFWWEGIDGTRVFTHFPPVDTYNSDLSARRPGARRAQLRRARARGTTSLVPFGFGDGGGGPTREMLGRGAPGARPGGLAAGRRSSRPRAFFAGAEAE